MTGDHPAPEALARAVSEGAPREMTEHVALCDDCGLEWESAKRLRQLANELPFEAPAPERVLAVRARVIEGARSVRRFTFVRTGLYAALAVAAAAVLVIAIGGPVRAPIAEEPAPRNHGSVVAADGAARWSRRSAAPDEVVELQAGTIHVEVTPLGPGERFRIHAGDGEVEVRGTAFDVSVEAGHMARVAVDHGRVEVRGAGAPQTVLGAGERWAALPIEPNVAAEAPPHEPAPPPSVPRRVPAPKPAPAESASTVVPEPPMAERSVAPPPVVPPPAVPPPVAPLPAPPPAAPKAAPPTPVPEPASTDDRAREDDRRERRDQRRERQDSRRFR